MEKFAYKFPEEKQEMLEINIEDPEEAREFIRNHIEKGDLPIVSVEEKYAEFAKKGLRPYSNWQGLFVIRGTIGRSPMAPAEQKRIFFRVNVRPEQLEPVFTIGKRFHGTIQIDGPVPPDALEEITPKITQKETTH